MPKKLVELITYHHVFHRDLQHCECTAVVHVADILCRAESFGNGDDRRLPLFSTEALEVLDLSMADLEEIMDQMDRGLRDIPRKKPRAVMESFLQTFSTPVMAIDGALNVVACSRRMLSVFGLHSRSQSNESPKEQLTAAVAGHDELGDQLALATAQLTLPSDAEAFDWKHQEHSYEVRVFAMEDAEDRFLVLFEDKTEHHETEFILSRVRQCMDNVLKNIPLGIVVLNSELRINFVTDRQLQLLEQLGIKLTLFDAVGSSFVELLPEQLGKGWHELCQQVLADGAQKQSARQPYATEDGALVLSTSALPLPESAGVTGGVMLVSEDVTETTALEEELVRVGKLATVGEMVTMVNHEINNPLSIISSSSQAMRFLNPDLEEKIVKKLLTIEEQVKRISAVTEGLRSMEEVNMDEYIASGPQMIDVWKKDEKAQH